MLMTINNSLTGIPVEMVPALAGQASPYAANVAVPSPDLHVRPRFGAAISCFISGFKTVGSKS